jgi:hypothetical protein
MYSIIATIFTAINATIHHTIDPAFLTTVNATIIIAI